MLDSMKYLESTSGLHKLLLRVFQALIDVLIKDQVNLLDNIVQVLQLLSLGLLNCRFLGVVLLFVESAVIRIFSFPEVSIVFSPAIQKLKHLREENSQKLTFVVRTAMDGWDDSLHELGKDAENVDLWHLELNDELQERNCILSISWTHYKPRIHAVLY